MNTDTRTLTDRVRDNVLTENRCTLISSNQQRPTVLRASVSQDPRFELFHFVFSVCSQRVRGTLAEKGVTYGSNEIHIMPPESENYSPDYVRLRLASAAADGKRVGGSFNASTSVEGEGFDPLVVPTFVDHEAGRVVTDSKAICLYICQNITSGIDLIPEDIRAPILGQLDITDSMPHAALFYGADPDGDHRPAHVQAKLPGIHKYKIEAVERNIALADGDPQLLAAYQQKMSKEKAAANFVVDVVRMRAAINYIRQTISGLDDLLSQSRGQWLFDDRFTLADLVWGVNLFRFVWVGYGGLWTTEGYRPRVEAYANRLFQRQSVKDAIINWPGHPPSEFAGHLFSTSAR